MPSFERILVGWDGSPDAVHAVRVAAALAEDLGVDVVVLATLPRPPHVEASDEARAEMQARRAEVLADMAERASTTAGRPVAPVRIDHEAIDVDDPVGALCDYAMHNGCGFLVVGRHGMDQVVHPRLGRVTQELVRHCARPVMVVGHPEAGDEHRDQAGGQLRHRLRHPLGR